MAVEGGLALACLSCSKYVLLYAIEMLSFPLLRLHSSTQAAPWQIAYSTVWLFRVLGDNATFQHKFVRKTLPFVLSIGLRTMSLV